MKTALVYDRANKWGGAERVMLALHEMFPDAPLYTSVYDKKKAGWADVFKVENSFLQRFPHIISNHEMYPFLMPIAFEQFNFDNYDLVITVTSEAAKGILTKPHTKHICYCLTPTRYLWSGYNEYFKNGFLKFVSSPVVSYLKTWDKIASSRPDFYIAASNEVKRRIKEYYNKDSAVIYPPLTLDKKDEPLAKGKNDYFLVVSRLVSYKRIDLAVRSCNHLRLPLKIIGSGREELSLRKIAGPTIEFLGNVNDNELVNYYSHARALICPGLEDFGLTILEIQKYGKPVISYKGGGALETIIEGKTGIFFNNQTEETLTKILKNFDAMHFKSEDCRKQADKFSFNKFKSNFYSLVEKFI